MSYRGLCAFVASLLLTFLTSGRAAAQLNVGSDGSDGAFNPPGNIEIDLSLAATGTWTDPSPVEGQGVYDPVQWAVVFKYSSVNIAAGRTVTFKNHPSRAPVVWLVQGNATIAGTVNVNGGNGHANNAAYSFSEPGPGGFRGGRAWLDLLAQEQAGFGPGGARLGTTPACANNPGGSFGGMGQDGSNGGFGTPGPIYGNQLLLPLIGGSGGGGSEVTTCPQILAGAGAGGGAICIAAGHTLSLSGSILARGGSNGSGGGAGGGSGGAIRLVADICEGTGILRATGGTSGIVAASMGGVGRIRVEANTITLADPAIPPFSFGAPSNPPMVFPPALTPKVRCVSVAGDPVPADPRSSLNFPLSDTLIASSAPVTIVVEGENVPLHWQVEVRSVPRDGVDTAVFATLQPGSTQALSIWHAEITFPNGFAAVQARAFQP